MTTSSTLCEKISQGRHAHWPSSVLCLFLPDFVDLKIVHRLIGCIVWFSQSEVVLLSNASKYRKIWSIRLRTFLLLSQTSPGLFVSAAQVFWKYCMKRRNDQCGKTPFTTKVFFYISKNKFQPFSHIYIVVCERVHFEPVLLFVVSKMMIFVFDRIDNIVGKGENAGHQHFLVFPQCFQKGFFLRVVKTRDFVVKSWGVNCLFIQGKVLK